MTIMTKNVYARREKDIDGLGSAMNDALKVKRE